MMVASKSDISHNIGIMKAAMRSLKRTHDVAAESAVYYQHEGL
jgi:hypothetical protein